MDGISDPPTYYANFVTSVLNVDELSMEFRRVLVPHKRFLATDALGSATTNVPVTAEDIATAEPVARVVLTFSAAKALYAYLGEVLPHFEAIRTGSPKK